MDLNRVARECAREQIALERREGVEHRDTGFTTTDVDILGIDEGSPQWLAAEAEYRAEYRRLAKTPPGS